MDEQEAARTLAAMHATRGRMANRARWSFGRHAAYGLVTGVFIASYALPEPWPIGGVVACLIATAVIVRRDRQRDGFFVNGYRSGRTRWLTAGMVVLTLGALFAAVMLKEQVGLTWAPVAIGGALAVLGTLGSMAWERMYRAELGGRDGD